MCMRCGAGASGHGHSTDSSKDRVQETLTPTNLLRRRREWVWALKRDFPHLAFSLNGQVEGCHAAACALAAPVPGSKAGSGSGAAGARIEGVMIGRAAYSAPWACLADADVAVWGAPANAATCRREVRHFCFTDRHCMLEKCRQACAKGFLWTLPTGVLWPLAGLHHAQTPAQQQWSSRRSGSVSVCLFASMPSLTAQ